VVGCVEEKGGIQECGIGRVPFYSTVVKKLLRRENFKHYQAIVRKIKMVESKLN